MQRLGGQPQLGDLGMGVPFGHVRLDRALIIAQQLSA
jgi:hypothetical protein